MDDLVDTLSLFKELKAVKTGLATLSGWIRQKRSTDSF